jgi:hypothetical protein
MLENDVMRKLALIAVASIFAASGAAPGAFASLSDRDFIKVHRQDFQQVAARGGGKGGDKGGRSDAGRSRDKGGKVIWRVRDKHHRDRLFFLFRGRGDCATRAVETRDDAGNIVVKNRWVCN